MKELKALLTLLNRKLNEDIVDVVEVQELARRAHAKSQSLDK